MAVHVQNRMIEQVAARTGMTFEEAAADLMATVPAVKLVSGDYQVWNRREDAQCDEWAARLLAGTQDPAADPFPTLAELATSKQVNFLVTLLNRVIRNEDGSAYGDLIREDAVNLPAVRKLSKAQASAVISQITGR